MRGLEGWRADLHTVTTATATATASGTSYYESLDTTQLEVVIIRPSNTPILSSSFSTDWKHRLFLPTLPVETRDVHCTFVPLKLSTGSRSDAGPGHTSFESRQRHEPSASPQIPHQKRLPPTTTATATAIAIATTSHHAAWSRARQ